MTNHLADESFESGDKFLKRTDASKVRPDWGLADWGHKLD